MILYNKERFPANTAKEPYPEDLIEKYLFHDLEETNELASEIKKVEEINFCNESACKYGAFLIDNNCLKIENNSLDDFYDTLEKFPNLKTLTFQGINNIDLKKIGQLPSLKNLYIIESHLCWEELCYCENLRNLDIVHTISDDLLTLPKIKNLKTLRIYGFDADFKTLKIDCKNLSEIENVDIIGYKTLILSGAESLLKLRSFYFDGNDLRGWECFPALPKLRNLNIPKVVFDENVFRDNAGSLKRLSISYAPCLEDCLSDNNSLESLSFSECGDVFELSVLSGLSKLQELNIKGSADMTEIIVDINVFDNWEHLSIIYLRNCKLSEEFVDNLYGIPIIRMQECEIEKISDKFLNNYLFDDNHDYFYGVSIKSYLHEYPEIRCCGNRVEIPSSFFISDCEIKMQPAHLFEMPRKFILDYANSEKISVAEGKVIFLGDGEVGKTTTIHRLLEKNEEIIQTPGIEISTYPVDNGNNLNFLNN